MVFFYIIILEIYELVYILYINKYDKKTYFLVKKIHKYSLLYVIICNIILYKYYKYNLMGILVWYSVIL